MIRYSPDDSTLDNARVRERGADDPVSR